MALCVPMAMLRYTRYRISNTLTAVFSTIVGIIRASTVVQAGIIFRILLWCSPWYFRGYGTVEFIFHERRYYRGIWRIRDMSGPPPIPRTELELSR